MTRRCKQFDIRFYLFWMSPIRCVQIHQGVHQKLEVDWRSGVHQVR
jgi:hypothetical protein